MRASIVVAAHNEGVALQRTIQACLETAGRLDFELVVADDASTDGSVEGGIKVDLDEAPRGNTGTWQ
jgi:glycosyltransferase involved in cell wall biosynthesis